jgi:hypothetical protein
MAHSPISPIFYPLLNSATKSLDLKVKSPWPGQTTRREEFVSLWNLNMFS